MASSATPQPRVVLVHGSMSSSAQWADYPALLPGLDVVAVDLPGHGARRAEPFTIDGALDTIAVAASVAAPVVLVGHSLGGYLCGLYAARRGGLAGVVIVGATGNPRGRFAAPYRLFAWLTGRVSHRRLARLRGAVARRLGVRGGLLDEEASYAELPGVWRAVARDCPPRVLADVRCPLVFINGQFDQMRIDERRYLNLVSGSRLETIRGATHFAPLTHAPDVAARIRHFVDGAAVPRQPRGRCARASPMGHNGGRG
ncbi:alpha/beta fold hydrolase [Tessaracoccus sp. G1721]